MKLRGSIIAKWRNGLIGTALASVAGLVCLTPMGSSLIGLSYDSLYLFRPEPRQSATVFPIQDVVILYMDLESETRLGQKRWQSWDRALHARLLQRLKEYRPRAVVFDILFVDSPDDPEGDKKLVQAAKDVTNVVVASKPSPEIHEGEIMGWQLKPPFPKLREVVTRGVVEVADANKSVRQHYYRKDFDEPSMAWRAAQLTMSNPPPPFTPRWINYYGPPGTIPHFSYYELFETNAISLAALSNKVVFVGGLYDVGFSGGKRSDDFRTPYTRRMGRRSPGVEISATAYLNFVRGDWLRRMPAWAEASLMVLAGSAFGFLLAARRPIWAVGLGALGFLLIGGVTLLVAWQKLVWFPWLIIGAVQIPTAIGWSILAHATQLHREKHALEQALALASRGEAAPSPTGAAAGLATAAMYARLDVPSPFITPTPGGPWPSSPDHQPTAVVADHQLLRCIGKGAYGEVWLARDVIGTFHAVKVVHQHSPHDPAPLEREFNGIKNFTPISRSHPGFVHILHVGRNEAAGYIYCVMELGDDENTEQKINPETYSAKNLARELKRRGRLPLPECLQLGIQLADALEHLHRHKLIHRDIKPSNIIFVGGVPKFADIGLVTAVATEGRQVTVVGTPGRMAPEGPGKPSADVYGLGKVLYEAGFGLEVSRFPELPTEVIQSADQSAFFEFNRIIMKACQLDERRRFQTAEALREELARLLDRVQATREAPG